MIQWMKPSEILYCQENIDGKFHRGHTTPLLDTFKELLTGELTPEDFPSIVVVRYENACYVYEGHRRLFLFKKLEEAGNITEIAVNLRPLWEEKFLERLDTISEGHSIRIRHPPDLHQQIDFCIFQYKEEQRLKSKKATEKTEMIRRCHSIIDSFTYPRWKSNALKAAIVIFYSREL